MSTTDCWIIAFYAPADNTLLVGLSAIASEQANTIDQDTL
jgi:hypothetical protein